MANSNTAATPNREATRSKGTAAIPLSRAATVDIRPKVAMEVDTAAVTDKRPLEEAVGFRAGRPVVRRWVWAVVYWGE